MAVEMPLEASDYEKIQASVQRVADQQEKALDKLNTVIAGMVPRVEYEARHINLADRVTGAEQNMRDFVKWAMSEHEKLQIKTSEVQKDLDEKFDKVMQAIDSIKQNTSTSRQETIRQIISYIVSFILGGGLLGIIEFLIHR